MTAGHNKTLRILASFSTKKAHRTFGASCIRKAATLYYIRPERRVTLQNRWVINVKVANAAGNAPRSTTHDDLIRERARARATTYATSLFSPITARRERCKFARGKVALIGARRLNRRVIVARSRRVSKDNVALLPSHRVRIARRRRTHHPPRGRNVYYLRFLLPARARARPFNILRVIRVARFYNSYA